jgi:hypothetical protein
MGILGKEAPPTTTDGRGGKLVGIPIGILVGIPIGILVGIPIGIFVAIVFGIPPPLPIKY